eukprot:352754-Chlamydomonas_euryale.AAC.2
MRGVHSRAAGVCDGHLGRVGVWRSHTSWEAGHASDTMRGTPSCTYSGGAGGTAPQEGALVNVCTLTRLVFRHSPTGGIACQCMYIDSPSTPA